MSDDREEMSKRIKEETDKRLQALRERWGMTIEQFV
jgi:hypothetical protein